MGWDAQRWGAVHRRERARWAVVVEAGGAVCRRCGLEIVPGTPWDLGHSDYVESARWGPEHRRCNRRAGLLKGQGRLAVRQSREW